MSDQHDDNKTVINKGGVRLTIKKSDALNLDSPSSKKLEVEPLKETEQVTRLEIDKTAPKAKNRLQPEKRKFEKLEELDANEDIEEGKWGSKTETPGSASLMIAGAVVVLLLIILVYFRGLTLGDEEKEENKSNYSEQEIDLFAGSPEKWFRSHAANFSSLALPILKGFLNEKTDVGRAKWVRNPDLYLAHSKDPHIEFSPRIEDEKLHQWQVAHIEDTGYLILKTKNADFMPARVYFTREKDGLKIDWAASTALSDIPLGSIKLARQKELADVLSKPKLPENIFTQGIVLRCLLTRKGGFYAGIYDDEHHSSYKLISPDYSQQMWGYVKKDSKLDEELKSLLDYGSFVVSLKKNKRVTLRVKINKNATMPSQLELVELVHTEWISP